MPPIAALLPFVTTLAGGIAALRLRHRLHPFMAVAAGVLVATAVADVLPEAHELVDSDSALEVGIAALASFIACSLIEAFIHQESFEHEHAAREGPGAPAHERSRRPPLVAILPPVSLILHSTLDGLAIGLPSKRAPPSAVAGDGLPRSEAGQPDRYRRRDATGGAYGSSTTTPL